MDARIPAQQVNIMSESQHQAPPDLPRIWLLKDVCRRYIPQAPATLINIARPAPDGFGYVATLGGIHLRLCKIGTRWAVTDDALRDFLTRSGVPLAALQAPAQAAQPQEPPKRRPGRPRLAATAHGAREA